VLVSFVVEADDALEALQSVAASITEQTPQLHVYSAEASEVSA
jgi:hypothetical protein